MKRILYSLLLALLFLPSLHKAALSAETDHRIIIGTGLTDAVYHKMYSTLSTIAPDLVMEYTKTTGGQDNINAMLHHDADAGFVQTDVLEFMRRTEPQVGQKICSLVGLHNNYLYAFTLKDGVKTKSNWNPFGQTTQIKNIRQLQGRTVAVFSSAQVTARIANERLHLNMKFIDVEDKNKGFELLEKGAVAACFVTGGKFIPWVEREVDPGKFSLVGMYTEDVQKMGWPYFTGKVSYKKFGAGGIGVVCIGVRNELVCWNYTGPRSQDLLRLRHFLKEHLNEIQEMRGSNASWQEIDQNTLDSFSWQRYMPGR